LKPIVQIEMLAKRACRRRSSNSDVDNTVPLKENSAECERRYQKAGASCHETHRA
jgi:hypothetical protein